MAKRLFIGNVSWNLDEAAIQEAFAPYGAEEGSVTLPRDDRNRSKGFAFVDVPDENAEKAVEEMNGKELDGRAIVVNEARPREERAPRSY